MPQKFSAQAVISSFLPLVVQGSALQAKMGDKDSSEIDGSDVSDVADFIESAVGVLVANLRQYRAKWAAMVQDPEKAEVFGGEAMVLLNGILPEEIMAAVMQNIARVTANMPAPEGGDVEEKAAPSKGTVTLFGVEVPAEDAAALFGE